LASYYFHDVDILLINTRMDGWMDGWMDGLSCIFNACKI